MDLEFFVEGGENKLAVTYTSEERLAIDEQCAALGMTTAKVTKPCGMSSESPLESWKASKSGVFANAVKRWVVNAHSFECLNDSFNDPLYAAAEGGSFNLALLRLKLEPNERYIFTVSQGFPRPEDIQGYVLVLADILRGLMEDIVGTKKTVKVKIEVL